MPKTPTAPFVLYLSLALVLDLALYSRPSRAFLIHKGEKQTHGGGDEGVHGFVQEFGRKHAPDEEVVSKTGDQNHVEHDWDGPQERKAVAAMTETHYSPEREQNKDIQSGYGPV